MASEERRSIAAGAWHPPFSSAATPATLEESGETIAAIAGGTVVASADFAALKISDRVGNVARRIAFPDGSLFETPDNGAIDELVASHRGANAGWVHRAEAFRPRLIGFVAAAVVFLVLLYRFGLPALVEVAVAVTPPVVPQMMSSGTLQGLDTTVFSETELSEESQKPIRDGFATLAANSPRGAAGYKLNFRQGGLIGPNAFALPDGTLVVTDELVDLAEGDTEMLLAVLAHEIGHVDLEHSLRQFYRAMGTAGLIMLIGGDIGDGVEDVIVEGGGLLSLSYSRSAETAADAHSVALMHKSGREPEALARFFELLEKELGDTSDTSFMSTHPGTPERKQAVRDLAAKVKAGG